MSQSLCKILIHIVFSTKKRQQWLSKEICNELYPYIAQILKSYDCYYRTQIGGIADHIHILCVLPKTVTTSFLVEKIKSNSSRWIKHKGLKDFAWQTGYGAFSISPAHIKNVISYINNQETHHKKTTFEEELLRLIRKYHITHDERYLFD